MKGLKFILTTLMVASLLSGCGEKTVNITFHQDEGNQNDVFQYVVGQTTYKEVKAFQDEIKLNSRYGNDVTWEDFDLSEINEDYVVNAKYSLHDYVISYKYETRLIGTATYTIESTEVKEPELPSTSGYVYHYEDYTFKGKAEDFTVRAIRELATYHATFVDIDGNPICDPIPFTINTTEIEEPAVPEIAGKDGAWEYYVLGAEDIIIHPVYTTRYFHAYFWTSNDEGTRKLVADVPFLPGTTFLQEPAVPLSADYRDGHWCDYTLDAEVVNIYPIYGDLHNFVARFLDGSTEVSRITFNSTQTEQVLPTVDTYAGKYSVYWINDGNKYQSGETIELPCRDLVFTIKKEGIPYTVTLDPNGGNLSGSTEVTVVYGSNYTLETPTYFSSYFGFLGWFTADGQRVSEKGTWNVVGNLALKARFGIQFDGGVPSFISAKENASLSVSSEYGDKCLKVDVPGYANYGVNFSKEFLDAAFFNGDVKAITFEALASEASINFGAIIGGENVTYEKNASGYGLDTRWKKFSFNKTDYQNYADGDTTLVGRFAGTNRSFFVRNILPSYKELDSFGFENGYLNLTENTYMSGGHTKPSEQIVKLVPGTGGEVNDIKFDYSDKTEGNRSLAFTKTSQAVSIYLSADIKTALGAHGYVSFDLKSSINIKSNPTTKNLVDGNGNPFGADQYEFPKNSWIRLTCYVDNGEIQGITSDGKFLTLKNKTAGTYHIDNIEIVHAD